MNIFRVNKLRVRSSREEQPERQIYSVPGAIAEPQ